MAWSAAGHGAALRLLEKKMAPHRFAVGHETRA
jgi:hypothetical protein